MSRRYYAVVNDAPMRQLARNEDLVLCNDPDGLEHNAVYADKETATEKRNRLRQKYSNPAINLYRLTLQPTDGES